MAIQRIQFDRKAIRQILRSDEVRQQLVERMRSVQNASGGELTTDVSREAGGWGRVRVRVYREGLDDDNIDGLTADLDRAGGRPNA